jgi:hypothetical protein
MLLPNFKDWSHMMTGERMYFVLFQSLEGIIISCY